MNEDSSNLEYEKSEDQQIGINGKNLYYLLTRMRDDIIATKISINDEDSPISEAELNIASQKMTQGVYDYNQSDIVLRGKILKHFAYCSDSKNLQFDYPPINFESLIELCTEGIRMKPKSSKAYYYRAKAKELSGNKIGAISDLDKAVELKPNQASLYFERAALKEKANQLLEAIADLKIMMQHKKNTSLDFMRMSTYKLVTYDFMGALEDMNSAIQLKPTSAIMYYSRGCIKTALNDSLGAIDDYTKSIELDPNYSNSYYNCGVEKMGINDFEGALVIFNVLLEKKDAYINSYFCRALAKMETDDLLGAVVDFRKGKTIKPNPINLQYEAELEFYNSEKYKFSIEGFEKYILTDSDKAKRYLAHLVNVSTPLESILPDDFDNTVIQN